MPRRFGSIAKNLILLLLLSFFLSGSIKLDLNDFTTTIFMRVANSYELALIDIYQGLGNSNVNNISLSKESGFVTTLICIKNLSKSETTFFQDNFSIIDAGGEKLYPMGQGYNSAELFTWLVPILEPVGAKGVVEQLIYFPIQSREIVRIPAAQSQGCHDSYQYKTYALLFEVNKNVIDKPLTLYFVDQKVDLVARKSFTLPRLTRRVLIVILSVIMFTPLLIVFIGSSIKFQHIIKNKDENQSIQGVKNG